MQQFMQEYSLQEIRSACISRIKTIVLLYTYCPSFQYIFAYAKHLIPTVQKAHINLWNLQNSPEYFYYLVMTINNSKGNPVKCRLPNSLLPSTADWKPVKLILM